MCSDYISRVMAGAKSIEDVERNMRREGRVTKAAPELHACLRSFVDYYRSRRQLLGVGTVAQDHFIKAAALLASIDQEPS